MLIGLGSPRTPTKRGGKRRASDRERSTDQTAAAAAAAAATGECLFERLLHVLQGVLCGGWAAWLRGDQVWTLQTLPKAVFSWSRHPYHSFVYLC